MGKKNSIPINIILSLGIIVAAFVLSQIIQAHLGDEKMIPALFALSVFLISLLTDGYVYGIVSALVIVLIVNNVFTVPFYQFNFTIPENLISAIILIIITLVTSTMTTRLKNAEEARMEGEMEKLRANLLRSVSHDFRTPLTTIYGNASALLDSERKYSPEKQREMLGAIKSGAEWLSRIVENMLSITKIDAAGVSIVKTPTALDELIDSSLLVFRKHYPGSKVELNLPSEVVIIPMDAILIQQVIVNLLENAVQHAAGMKRLSLSVYTEENTVCFEIADDGCGIDQDSIQKMFTGFYYRNEHSGDNRGHNVGIGLTVCANIIRAHGGRISAENRKEGGAVFRFTLDLEENDNE